MNLITAFLRCLTSSEKGLNVDSNPDLCDAGPVLYQMSHQANWEQVVMLVDYKPVDVEMDDDDNTRMRSGMKFIHSTAPASQRSGFESPFRPEFFRPFSLLLKQRKNAMIKFIHSTPHFKYKSLYYHQSQTTFTRYQTNQF